MKREFFMIYLILIAAFPLGFSQEVYGFGEEITVSKGSINICGGFNVKDSLVLSIVTLCLGGVLEKTQQWREIKCEAIVCYYDAIQYNLDPSFCNQQEAYLTCAYIVGEVFALPPLSALEGFREAMAQLLANPIGVAWGAAVTYIRKFVLAPCLSTGTCSFGISKPQGFGAVFVGATDVLSAFQKIKGIFENGFSGILEPSNKCDRVVEIRAEMQEILGLEVDEDEGFLGGLFG